MGTNAQQGTLMNIVVGIVGAFLAGWILTPLLGIATINKTTLVFRHSAFPCSALSSCWRSSGSFSAANFVGRTGQYSGISTDDVAAFHRFSEKDP
ncbi:MAG: GlsB/YeaQ/YmgE family stress response membrane protein [Caldilineaceae bacterium]